MLYSKNKQPELLTNVQLEKALNKFHWEHIEDEHSAYEILKITEIEKKSVILAIIIRSLDMRLKLDNYTYYRKGMNILCRSGGNIKIENKYSKYHLGEPFTRVIDTVKHRLVTKEEQQEEGVVLKVE